MKQYLPNGCVILLVLTTLCSQWACRSDAPADTKTPGTETQQTGTLSGGDAAANLVRETPDLAGQAQALDQKIKQFYNKVKALRDEVSAVPAATKKYALDYDELEAFLDGYLEKGAYLQDELRQATEAISGKAGVQAGSDATGGSGSDILVSKLQELQDGLDGLDAAYGTLDKAVKTLKNAKGQLRLFEDEGR